MYANIDFKQVCEKITRGLQLFYLTVPTDDPQL